MINRLHNQKPWKEVSEFWDSTAQWRTAYFEGLTSSSDDALPLGLRMEKDFVVAEEHTLNRLFNRPDTDWIVELGCGIGRSLLPFACDLPLKTFIGLDFSLEQLFIFRKRCVEEGLVNSHCVMCDVRKICLPDKSAELVIICNQTVGNFLGDAREEVLKEISRILAPGGLLYIGGFDQITFAQECYKEWGVNVESIDERSGLVMTSHYNTLWQPEALMNSEVFGHGFSLLSGFRCGLGYLNTYRKS